MRITENQNKQREPEEPQKPEEPQEPETQRNHENHGEPEKPQEPEEPQEPENRENYRKKRNQEKIVCDKIEMAKCNVSCGYYIGDQPSNKNSRFFRVFTRAASLASIVLVNQQNVMQLNYFSCDTMQLQVILTWLGMA